MLKIHGNKVQYAGEVELVACNHHNVCNPVEICVLHTNAV